MLGNAVTVSGTKKLQCYMRGRSNLLTNQVVMMGVVK